MKIKVYAVSKNGDGHVLCLGEYEDWNNIKIHCGMFAPDVVITFEIENDNEQEK